MDMKDSVDITMHYASGDTATYKTFRINKKDIVDVTIHYVSGRIVTYKTFKWTYKEFKEILYKFQNDVHKAELSGYSIGNPFSTLEIVDIQDGHPYCKDIIINLNNIKSFK